MNPSDSLTAAPKVAIYWDFENIHASLYEQEVGRYRESRYRTQDELVEVGAIMDFARSLGSVCINRAYCNWSFYYCYSDALTGHGVSLVQLFPRGQHGKNGADIQMCVDMVEDFLRLDLDVCVIVSGDSDYIGAAQKVRQYGKRVIGVGVRDCTNRYFQRVCDEFKFYDTLVQSEAAAPLAIYESGTMDFDAARQLLVAAVNRLVAQTGEPAILKARVKPMMLRLEPTFDERGVKRNGDGKGFDDFTSFLNACEDIIVESAGQSDHTIQIREGATVDFARGQIPEEMRQACRRLIVAAMTYRLGTGQLAILLSALKPAMKRLEPEFDEKALGARNFLTFLTWFPDIVRIHGEGERRTVELLVERNTGGFELPEPSGRADTTPPERQCVETAMAFMFGSLRDEPATNWPEYFDRLKSHMERSGFSGEADDHRAIKKVLWDAGAFKLLPNHGGITVADHFQTFEALRDQVLRHMETNQADSDEA